MLEYKLSKSAEEDLIRIHQYGVVKFGIQQADKYYHSLFTCFDAIAQRPYSFKSVDHIRPGYRRCVCGVDSIYFRVFKGHVHIMAIVGRQDLMNTL